MHVINLVTFWSSSYIWKIIFSSLDGFPWDVNAISCTLNRPTLKFLLKIYIMQEIFQIMPKILPIMLA